MNHHWFQFVLFLAFISLNTVQLSAQESQDVDFASVIRPILSDYCFKCHGPDEVDRQADLRLDTKAGVFGDHGLLTPGDSDNSELFRRLTTEDEDERMPPVDSGRELSRTQIEHLRRWIDQGAAWQQHWSFITPVKPQLPKVSDPSWVSNPIDQFVLAKLDSHGFPPNQPAQRATLIRRVALDLTGLPPELGLLNQYLNNESPDWYEQLVDELLASPQYGEHMARYWLDVARYADTHGLHLDNYREMWPYRDWIIQAFNENQSFKDFAIEQLAGDLLPDPTESQLVATGFNRSHVTTSEGGAIEEEVYVRNVVDRVSTTGTVFLGLTIGCAQCHDHKFDPVSQKEFYQLFAFFNSLDGSPLDGNRKDHAPFLRIATDEQRQDVAKLESEIQSERKSLKQLLTDFEYTDPGVEPDSEDHDQAQEFTWIDDDAPEGAKKEQRWQNVAASDGPVNSGKYSRLQEAGDQMVQHFFINAATPLLVNEEDTLFAYVFLDPRDPPSQIMLQFNDGNWEHRAYWGGDRINWGQNDTPSRQFLGDLPAPGSWVRLEIPAVKVGFKKRQAVNGMAFTQWGGKAYWDNAGVVSKIRQGYSPVSLKVWAAKQKTEQGKGLTGGVKSIVQKAYEEWSDEERATVREYFLKNVFAESKKMADPRVKTVESLTQKVNAMKNQWPLTLIWKERSEPKPAYFLERGEYDQKRDKVERNVPAAFPPLPDDATRDRLGLANWLFDPGHPLTARVTVNRFWQQVFGQGIVSTSEDFGAQGAVPTHPDLLDWMAVDFVEQGWDVKRLMKLIVMSSTYRQSSVISPDVLAKDPDNQFYARGPRFRMDAELLRDQALAVSGLLVSRIGGPSVKPPQPDGLWFVVGYSGSNTVRFKKDVGHEKVHRRSLYTFLKRTAPSPQMNTFDAPSRESCTVRRERTNTPLQALLLMNDPQYVEAGRYLAQRVLEMDVSVPGNASVEDEVDRDLSRVDFLIRQALCRPSTKSERQILFETLNSNRKEFESNRDAAIQLVTIGEIPADVDRFDPVELASWAMVANLVMNMDEFLNKN